MPFSITGYALGFPHVAHFRRQRELDEGSGVFFVCGAGREAGFQLPQAHILTPADAHTTHYFWSSTRCNDLDNPQVDAMLRELFGEAFDIEDKPMIEAAYDNVRGNLDAGGDFWGEKPLSLGIDQGGTRARRIIERMLVQELASA